jgi:hypothetical protein
VRRSRVVLRDDRIKLAFSEEDFPLDGDLPKDAARFLAFAGHVSLREHFTGAGFYPIPALP